MMASMVEADLRFRPQLLLTESPIRKVASCASVEALLGQAAGRSATTKRVQFADEMGLQLTRVRVMREPSWVPPALPRYIVARHCLTDATAPADKMSDATTADQRQDQESDPAMACKFECKFVQPSSRYIVFREHLERHSVCLNGLHFEGRTAIGLVSVKNVCFRKRVFVRVTFNGWSSFQDIEAAHSGDSTDGCGHHDNFGFSFPCPTSLSELEFCICFVAGGSGDDVSHDELTFWDNNSGENYRVAVKRKCASGAKTDGGSNKSDGLSSIFDHVTDFSEFAAWKQHDQSDGVVYY